MMTPTPPQPGSSQPQPDATVESQPDGQCPPPADLPEMLKEIVQLQQSRLSSEHLCRVAVQDDDWRLARRHAARAAELDRRHQELVRMIWATEDMEDTLS